MAACSSPPMPSAAAPIAKGPASGAKVAAGGSSSGAYYSPTVLTDLAPDNRAWREEIFGPVAPVIRFSDLEEAIALTEDNEYGLSLGVGPAPIWKRSLRFSG